MGDGGMGIGVGGWWRWCGCGRWRSGWVVEGRRWGGCMSGWIVEEVGVNGRVDGGG